MNVVERVLIDTATLITEVYMRKPLWETTHKEYHNRLILDRLWDEIAYKTQSSKDDCKRRWKNLRDRYRLELKKFDLKQKDDKTYASRWPYFVKMEFLKKYMHSTVLLPRNLVDESQINANAEEAAEEDSVIEMIKNEIHLDVDENSVLVDTPNELSTANDECHDTLIAKKRIKLKSIDTVVDNLNHTKDGQQQQLDTTTAESSLNTQQPQLNGLNGKESEDLLFFKSLLGYMEKFTPIQKLRVRNQITTVIINELTEITRASNFTAIDVYNEPEDEENEDSNELRNTKEPSSKFFEY